MTTMLTQLTFLGLLLGITGGVFISKSVFFKRNQDIFDTSPGYLGYSQVKTLDAITAKREALFGCVLLILGFIGQFGGALESGAPIHWLTVLCFGLGLIPFSLAASYFIKRWSVYSTDRLVGAYKKAHDN